MPLLSLFGDAEGERMTSFQTSNDRFEERRSDAWVCDTGVLKSSRR